VIAPCGFTIQRTMEEIHLLTEKTEWAQLTAVQNQAVFVADYDLFTQPSAGTLTDGIELLAAMFHPTIFKAPAHLQHKFQSLFQTVTAHV
jgi:iron complex transport system substrate-binding protein